MADQMILFPRAFRLAVSLASSGMLEDHFLQAKLVDGKSGDVERAFGRSSFPCCAGTVTS